MLNAQQPQTIPAVPIGLKKAQQKVAGSMGSSPGAHGPQIPSTKELDSKPPSKLEKPKKKFPLKYIIAGIILFLLLLGAGAGIYLTQIKQDVRQQASTGAYCVEGQEFYCGGCIQGCKPATKTCSTWIDEVCSAATDPSPDATTLPGSGDSGECALGDEAAIRECLATQDTIYNSGACNGMTEAECMAWCESNSDCNIQTCTGDQEQSGDRQGEFLTCNGSGGTGGCGQVDMIGPNGEVLGFVMDTTSCTGSGGGGETTNPTDKPKSSPKTKAKCNEACTKDNNCGGAGQTCIDNLCRLTENSTSESCEEEEDVVLGCNDLCQVSTDCSQENHVCYEYDEDGNPDGGVCRLIENPTSKLCEELPPEPSPTPTIGCNDACVTSSDCSDVDHMCNSETDTCRLTENPTDENCAPAVPEESPAPGCNEECFSSNDCSNEDAVCYDNLCRLSTNPTSTSCQPKDMTQTTGEFYEQPDLPQSLPESGSEDIVNWLKAGLGALGLGLVFLFL